MKDQDQNDAREILACKLIRASKLVIAGILTLLVRLVTPALGLPGFAPLMTTEVAASKSFGPWIAGLYGAAGMVVLDACMHALGPWTALTALCYGAVAIASGLFLRHRAISGRSLLSYAHFLWISVAGTLFFDLVTGVVPNMIDGMTFMQSVIERQGPFTLVHLAGNAFFAVFGPWFTASFMESRQWEWRYLMRDIPQARRMKIG